MSTTTRVRSGSQTRNQPKSPTIKRPSLINLSRMLEGEIVWHYDRFVAEHLSIRLLGQYDNYADFIFMTSSSQKGHDPYQVRIRREYHACPFAPDGFGPCSKHGDVVGSCTCQANVEKRRMCKHLAAGYTEAQRLVTEQGRTVRLIDLDYWHPEPIILNTAAPEHAPWELAEIA